MCVCKRNRTSRSSIRMGWDHMVSETSAERFVFRARTGPLCPSESSKMQLCGHRDKAETVIGTVTVRVFDVCATNFINYVCEGIFLHDNQVPHPKYQRFCALISVRLRKARTYQVASGFRCAASLRTHPHMYHQRSSPSCIHLQLHVKGAVLLSSMHCNHGENLSENPWSCTCLKDPRSGVHYSW